MTMYQYIPITKSISTTEVSNVRPQIVRPQTPCPDDRFSRSFKSLFTLADVAAKRRASGGFKKRASKTNENAFDGDEASGSVLLRRSRSSGDIVELGERSRRLNVEPRIGENEVPDKLPKVLRSRAATTPASPRSKIPKVKSTTWQHTTNTPSDGILGSSAKSAVNSDCSDGDALSVDDAVFVLITPPRPSRKVLTLAAHTPSLPRIASPFSPRTNEHSTPPPLGVRSGSPRSSRSTGHTSASLHLTKSHWELRYDTWTRSLHMQRPPKAVENAQCSPTRSRFPAPPTNPALFPRAGSLTPTALRPVLDGTAVTESTRPALEVDWAMRAWPLDKIQRALFTHDMDVRVCFPITASESDNGEATAPDLMSVPSKQAREDQERENEHMLRRWEWDWELRWRVIEGMAEDDDAAQCEYDVFLAEEDAEGDRAYGGCEMQGGVKVDADWEWTDDAMEVDAIL